MGQRPIALLGGLYVFCVVLFLASILLPHADGQLIGSDGQFYYAYLPTLLIDHDLNFENQYEKLLSEKSLERQREAGSGRLPNKYAIGPAILWIPFFLMGHILALSLNAVGYSITLDGSGYVYQAMTLIGSITYGFIGILLVYRSCRHFFSQTSSASAAILVWLATNVVYYTLAEPSMSHSCSFFAMALFIDIWLRFRPAPTGRQWILLGIAGGLVALVRLQDITWLALPFLDAVFSMRRKSWIIWASQVKGFMLFGLAALIVFAPQIVVWQILNTPANAASYPHSGGHFFWFTPEIFGVLFSLRHGFFLWHPVLLLAAAGLFFLYRKDRSIPVLFGVMLLAQLYLVGSWHGWWGGHSFGNRLLINSIPALALGLAALIDWTVRRDIFPAAGVVAMSLIVWNALFFAQYRLGYINKYRAISVYELTVGKFAMIADLANRL